MLNIAEVFSPARSCWWTPWTINCFCLCIHASCLKKAPLWYALCASVIAVWLMLLQTWLCVLQGSQETSRMSWPLFNLAHSHLIAQCGSPENNLTGEGGIDKCLCMRWITAATQPWLFTSAPVPVSNYWHAGLRYKLTVSELRSQAFDMHRPKDGNRLSDFLKKSLLTMWNQSLALKDLAESASC